MKKLFIALSLALLTAFSASSQTTLAKGTVSAVGTVTIDFSSYYTSYDYLEILIYGAAPVTDNVNLEVRVSPDASTFASGSSDYNWEYTFNGVTNASADNAIHLVNGQSNAAGKSLFGKIRVVLPNSTSFNPAVSSNLTYELTSTVVPIPTTGLGYYQIAAQITKAIQIFYSSGNIATLSYKVIGYAN